MFLNKLIQNCAFHALKHKHQHFENYLYSNVISQNVPNNYSGGFSYLMSDSRYILLTNINFL